MISSLKDIAGGEELRRKPIDVIEEVQLHLLRKHLVHAQQTQYYRQIFKDLGFEPYDIHSISDLVHLPFTERKDLEGNEKLFWAVEPKRFCDVVQTSGTTSSPITIGYTANDLRRLSFNEAMAFHGAGIGPDDVILSCVTMDRVFIAGLAYFLGAQAIGATFIRSGPGQIERQIRLLEVMDVTTIIGVPSFINSMCEKAREIGLLGLLSSKIKTIVAIGEPVRTHDFSTNLLGAKLSEALDAKIISTYAGTEFQTCFTECIACCGGHCHPELAIIEVIDENGQRVPDGEPGELVITPLGVEGMPLVRYKTGDITRLHRQRCACGWNTPRIGPIEGRKSFRLKYKGTTFYPETIFNILFEELRIDKAYVEINRQYDLSEEVLVVVARSNGQVQAQEIEQLLRSRLRVRVGVKILPEEEVEQKMTSHGGRKPRRVFDHRVQGEEII